MKTNLLGLHADIDNETYHSLTSYVSSSMIRELEKSPAHLQAYLAQKREPTKSMKFGTGFHALIGEPELFAKLYVKAPEGIDRRTKAGKEAWVAFESENAGKQILSSEEYDALDGMLYSLLKNKSALALLTNGKAEQSVFWKDQATGVQCKCRPDYLREDGIIVDLKTTDDASVKGFQRSIANYSYHIQSAFYLNGVSQVFGEPLDEFVHLVVEKKPPYAVGIYTLDDVALSYAREQIKKLLALYADCSAKNDWPAYTCDIQNISLPAWMFNGGVQ